MEEKKKAKKGKKKEKETSKEEEVAPPPLEELPPDELPPDELLMEENPPEENAFNEVDMTAEEGTAPPEEGAPPAEGEAPPPAEEAPPPPVAQKRRSRFFVNWDRPTHLSYSYNMDYASNYYKGMIDYLDNRSRGHKPDIPKPLSWEQRALNSYMDRLQLMKISNMNKDLDLLHKIQNSKRDYILRYKGSCRRVTTSMISY